MLKAPVQYRDGTVTQSVRGTPQGGVISPLLANLFLHYAFDVWMSRSFPSNPFERYADDVVVHCRTQAEAEYLKEVIADRMRECSLELHPEKTEVVCCKDDNRRDKFINTQFDFSGFTFLSRTAKRGDEKLFNGFNPAVSKKAKKAFSDKIRSWKIYRKSHVTIFDISRICNPMLRGWIHYFGSVYLSQLTYVLKRFNSILYHWGRRKYKRLRTRRRFFQWLEKMSILYPNLFEHWNLRGVEVWFVH